MARSLVRVKAVDRQGNAIQAAGVRFYELGTNTVVPVFAARVGGVALAQPVLTGLQGDAEVWTDYVADGVIDAEFSDNGDAAYFPHEPLRKISFDTWRDPVAVLSTPVVVPPDAVSSVDGRTGAVTLTDLYARLAAANIFTPPNVNATPITVRALASQVADLQRWEDSSGTPLAVIDSGGKLGIGTAPSLPFHISATESRLRLQSSAGKTWDVVSGGGGALTGGVFGIQNSTDGTTPVQIIGAGTTRITAQGAAVIPLTVKGAVSQTANLQQWQDSSGAGGAPLAFVRADGLLGVPFVSNQADNGPYFAFAAQQVELTSRGGAAGVPIFRINQNVATSQNIVVVGAAAQSANLQEWQDSAGAVKASVNSIGALGANGVVTGPGYAVQSDYFTDRANANTYLDMGGGIRVTNRGSVGNVPLQVRGLASQSANLQEWQDSAGVVKAKVQSNGQGHFTGYVGSSGAVGDYSKAWAGLYSESDWYSEVALANGSGSRQGVLMADSNLDALTFRTKPGFRFVNWGAVGDVPLQVRGKAGQTGDLFQAQNSAGAVKAKIDPDGRMNVGGSAIYADNGFTPGLVVENPAQTNKWVATGYDDAGDFGFIYAVHSQNAWKTLKLGQGSGAVLAGGSGIGTPALAVGGFAMPDGSLGTVRIQSQGPTYLPLLARGAASQTANLQEWQNSAGVIGAYLSAAGTAIVATDFATQNSGRFLSFSHAYLDSAADTSIHLRPGSVNGLLVDSDGLIGGYETALRIRRNSGGGSFSLERVSQGAADSGGAGFRVLRVPN